MGLCIGVNKTGDEWDIGYRGYFILRYLILKEIDENIADVWRDRCLNRGRRLTLEEFNIYHSDCSGILGRRKVKRTLLALEKIDLKNEDWKEYFDGLKNILRIAVANKSSVRYY